MGRKVAWNARGLVLSAAALLAACGPPAEVKHAVAMPACGGPRLAVCEKELVQAAATGEIPKDLLDGYVKARLAADGGDRWAELWSAFGSAKSAPALLIDTRPDAVRTIESLGGRSAQVRERLGLPWIMSAALPAPAAVEPAHLVYTFARAAGWRHVMWLGAPVSPGSASLALELFPRDPLEPMMFGVPAVARSPRLDGDGDPERAIVEALAVAGSVERVFDAAGAFRYVDAAKEAKALGERIAGRDEWEGPVMRARYARTLLSAAGIALEPPPKLFGDDAASASAPKTRPAPAQGSSGTPYGDLLRVRLADDPIQEFKDGGGRIPPAVPADRQGHLAWFFSAPAGCDDALAPPAFDRAADIALAGLLPGALAGARVEALAEVPSKGMPLSEWAPRYEALVRLVDRSHLAWLEMGALLRQRGELNGISTQGTPTYRRVTELGLSHLKALRELALTEPSMYTGTAELGLAYSSGLLGDEALRSALIDLTQSTAKAKLGESSEPEAIAGSLLAGVFAGMTYPAAIQTAHYLALQSAFAAKVKGDLSKKTGWGAAGLFALDAIFRIVADQGPNLAFSSAEIVRALSDPAIAQPSIAAVVSAGARYLALAKDKPLAAIASPAQSTPERAAAREALRKAIVDLGGPGEAPAKLADDVTTLADGLIAAASLRFHRKAPPPGTCSDKSLTAADIELSHALSKLREVRQRVLAAPRYKEGDGLWVRRARLLVTVLSDAIDYLAPAKEKEVRKLTIAPADVDAALAGALREWEEPGARDAVSGVYTLARFALSRGSGMGFEGAAPHLFRALGGLGRFLRGGAAPGAASGPVSGPTLLDALGDVSDKQVAASDLANALVGYAKAFYDKGQPDQGDVFLLGTLVLSSARWITPPKEAIALAAANRSRIEWALAMFAETAAAESTGRPSVQAFADQARAEARSRCAVARVDDVLSVMGAITQWNEGKRKEARAAIDAVLSRAESQGLVIPKIAYQYAEKHDHKIFTLSFGLTYGLGFVEGGNSFQIGVGLSTVPDRSAKLTASAASPEETANETARYYVRAAALGSAYAFLDGDLAQAATDARRAVSAIVSGVRLGARAVTDERARWAEDARALLALDAQLAADAAMPFLAGDLWTIVKDSLPRDADDAKIEEVLKSPPFGLAAVKDADAPLARARKSLKIVAAPLACTGAKVDTLSLEQPACGAYPLALAFRVADVIKVLPRLSSKKSGDGDAATCGALRALDEFLDAASGGTYDPDAFTKAVDGLRAGGRDDEAATLLARHRKDGHCTPGILKTARALGRSAALSPASRADMLAIAVNCAVPAGGAEMLADLQALDAETRKLPDPMRNLKLVLFVADLSVRAGRPDLLALLVRPPGFVDRYLGLHGNAVAGALLLHHTGLLLAGETFDPALTEGSFTTVCKTFPSDDRKTECDDLTTLRDPTKPADARKPLAKDALERLLAPPQKPPTKRP